MESVVAECWRILFDHGAAGDGFVPSYNLQVAVSVVAVEALRQRNNASLEL